MSKGWGYGKNWILFSINKAHKIFENEKMKVYKANIIYNGYLTITVIHDKVTKNKRVIMKYENKNAIPYDIGNKTLQETVDIISNELIDKYYSATI
ncbi:hypothetical protein NST17_19615 [Caldifermentibacillus hisashii]|uniref:Uncharacterized protein n=1 Tax=Caldifermentibacillus hisashii TaxID=996558 RepID=A0ABU9K2N5_9BACI